MPHRQSRLSTTSLVQADTYLAISLVYLENVTTFLRTVSEMTPEAVLQETFIGMSSDFDVLHKRVKSYRQHRLSQVPNDSGFPVTKQHHGLWQAINKQPVFLKPALGKSLALCVVSRNEAVDLALQYIMLGIAYFYIGSTSPSSTLRKLASNAEIVLAGFAADLSERSVTRS